MKVKASPEKAKQDDFNLAKRLPGDYPWKVLGWLTNDLRQHIGEEDYLQIKAVIRARNTDALLELADEWGLQSIPHFSDLDSMRIMGRYQLTSLLKNFRFPGDNSARRQAAMEKFMEGEAQCEQYNREGYKALSVASESWMVDVFTYMQSFMQKLLGFDIPDLSEMTERSRHGPGATTGTDAGRVSTYFKFEKWPYHCTARAARIARSAIEADERWLGALEDDYRRRKKIPMWHILDRKRFWADVIEVVDGNRIAFAPKNARTDRSIAIEPTLNLYLQLGVDGFIRRRLKRWNVNLDDQRRNQELARLGSIEQVDPFVTVDLRNASGTMALKLCKLVCPQDWYDLFYDLRSPCGTMVGSSEVKYYQMMSSMGNGFTFALESAIFTAVIYAVMKARLGVFREREFAVFGDDLVVRQSLAPFVVEALTSCGFKVNEGKSFFSGPVRESCGTDWYLGNPIRPVFLDEQPHAVDELFCDYNRLKRILELRFFVQGGEIEKMRDWIPEKFRNIKGPYSDEDFSTYIHFRTPRIYGVNYRNGLYNYQRLMRREVVVGAPKFLFRKLMHDLHPICTPVPTWRKWEKLKGSGSRFTVCLRSRYTVSQDVSSASYWQNEYTEYTPYPQDYRR